MSEGGSNTTRDVVKYVLRIINMSNASRVYMEFGKAKEGFGHFLVVRIHTHERYALFFLLTESET